MRKRDVAWLGKINNTHHVWQSRADKNLLFIMDRGPSASFGGRLDYRRVELPRRKKHISKLLPVYTFSMTPQTIRIGCMRFDRLAVETIVRNYNLPLIIERRKNVEMP